MIQPGQKLQEGDYVKGITPSQAVEILKKDRMQYGEGYENTCSLEGIVYYDNMLSAPFSDDELITEHTFPDFRQLCENTFGV